MALLRYLGRAAAWSLALLLASQLLAPLTRAILEGFTQIFLALAHATQPLEQRAHLGSVLFLALFLAAKPRGKRAIAYGVLGVLACIAAQGLTTALLLTMGDERRPLVRLLRDSGIAVDKIAPLAAALILAPRARRSGEPSDGARALSGRRRVRPALRHRRSQPPPHPLHPGRSQT